MRHTITQRRKPTTLTVAMTPMIDVVFLLLIFFLCTSSFQTPESDLAANLLVESDSPGASSPLDDLPQFDEVTLAGRRVAGATYWTVNHGPETSDGAALVSLLREIAAVDRSAPVTIEPGPRVPLGDVVRAYDAARLAQFATVRLAASAESLQTALPGAKP